MDYFQLVLPVYVDYLGCFEEGIDDVLEPHDVIRELNTRYDSKLHIHDFC